MISGEFRFHIHLDAHRNIRLQQAVDSSIVFDRHNYDRQFFRVLALVGKPSQPAAAIVENRSARPAVVASIAAGNHYSGRMLRRQTCTGYSTVVFKLSASRRSNSGFSTGFTSRIGPKKTIFPSSLPLYFSRSFSSFASIQIAAPFTAP